MVGCPSRIFTPCDGVFLPGTGSSGGTSRMKANVSDLVGAVNREMTRGRDGFHSVPFFPSWQGKSQDRCNGKPHVFRFPYWLSDREYLKKKLGRGGTRPYQ